MSRRTSLIVVSLTILVLGATLFHRPSENVQGTNDMKSLSLKRQSNILIKTSKLKPSFDIKIYKTNGDTVKPSEAFTLEAQIYTERAMSTLNYSWVLPDGLTLVAGLASGTISNLNPKNPAVISVQFSQKDEENKVIYLKTWSGDSSNPQLSTVQYNTVLQDEMDYERSELAKRNAEIILEQNATIVKTHK